MADMQIDEYLENVIKSGDQGSGYLASRAAPTLKHSQYVRVLKAGMNGLAVLDVPKNAALAVHSSGGDVRIAGSDRSLSSYAYSAVVGAVRQAKAIGAKPLAIADVLDCSSDNAAVLETLMDGIVAACNEYHIPVMNGEYAILGKRVVGPANITVTMLSELPSPDARARFVKGEDQYAVFHPEGKPVFMNSDGVGTKTEFYERMYSLHPDTQTGALALARATHDFLAMNADDASKKGAHAHILSGVMETKGILPVDVIRTHFSGLAMSMGITGILQHEPCDARISGYGNIAYNLSGTLVSTIDEDRLANPLVPAAGEHLIAIRKWHPNPRSNGITVKRERMIEHLGKDWHRTEEGRHFLEYLAEPSAVLYPLFGRLINSGLATSVYHMSGGAFHGKLAVPLAAHGLGASLRLFTPDPREVTLAQMTGDVRTAYAKWPMGNDAFISTNRPDEAIAAIESEGYDALVSGVLEAGSGILIDAFDGSKIAFNGQK
jgi:phosphoribosylaminoimidazole (AIR) synthetase